jgi:hypothetical protein
MHRVHIRLPLVIAAILISLTITPSQSAQRGGWSAPVRPAPTPYTPRQYPNTQPIPRRQPPPVNENRRMVRPPANTNVAPRSNVTQFPRQSRVTPLPRVGVSGLPRGRANAFAGGRSLISLEKKRAIQTRLTRLRAMAANRKKSSGSGAAGLAAGGSVGGGSGGGISAFPGGIGGDNPPRSITPQFNAAANQPRSGGPTASGGIGIGSSAAGDGGRTAMPAARGGIGGENPPQVKPNFNAAANQPRSGAPTGRAGSDSFPGSVTKIPKPVREGPPDRDWKNPGF